MIVLLRLTMSRRPAGHYRLPQGLLRCHNRHHHLGALPTYLQQVTSI